MNVDITNGDNIIRLLHDGFVDVLVIGNTRALFCPDCDGGSMGEYYAISDRPGDEQQARTQALTDVLIDGTDTEILAQIKTFLNLFANGKYSVDIKEQAYQDVAFWQYPDKVNYADHPECKWFSGGYYPLEKFHYILTRPKTTIDPKRVAYYQARISKGDRPKIVVFGNRHLGWCSKFVLDGHHKIQAYQSLEIDYPMVEITLENHGVDNTLSAINAATEILNEIELQHLLVKRPVLIDLVSVESSLGNRLNSILDNYLSSCRWPEVGIIELFRKYDKTNNERELLWLADRLKALRRNPKLGAGFTFPVKVSNGYEFRKFDHSDIDRWIRRKLQNYSRFIKRHPG